jgi:DNA polymerase III subunit epsilon
MGKFAFSTGGRAVNRVDICPVCETRKKLAIDKYCPDCGNDVKMGIERKATPVPNSDWLDRMYETLNDMTVRDRMIILSQLLMEDDFIIIDTETTGLGNVDEIVSISIINPLGETVLTSLVKPVQPILNSEFHGITNAMVAQAPTFAMLYPRIREAMEGRICLAYNYDFDSRMLRQSCARYGLTPIMPRSSGCVMTMYARFYGDWNRQRKDYRWQKLVVAVEQLGLEFPGAAHEATADCQAALMVLKAMAGETITYLEPAMST